MYARQVGDRTLTFVVSGKLWRNSLIMQDRETGSLWSHITGECLEGYYKGTTLAMVPVVQSAWSTWQAAHPQTRVLAKSEEIKSSRYERYFSDPERAGLFQTQWLRDRLPGKSLVHGVMVGAYSLAVADSALTTAVPVTADVGEVAIKMTRSLDGGVRVIRLDTGAELPVRTSYWFAWSTYFPRTAVID